MKRWALSSLLVLLLATNVELRAQTSNKSEELLRSLSPCQLRIPIEGKTQGQIFEEALASLKRRDFSYACMGFRLLAEKGHSGAQYQMGRLYLYGDVYDQSGEEAARWFRLAAEKGNADAQAKLGEMYDIGITAFTANRGLPQNYQEAARLYRLAAEQGHGNASLLLGAMYDSGKGVYKDHEEAVKWYRIAAVQGVTWAQRQLGFKFYMGEGVPKDDQQAYFWWLLASSKGDEAAKKVRLAIEKELTSEQRTSAQAAARNWQPKTAEQAKASASAGAVVEGSLKPAPSRVSPTTARADATGSGFRVARSAIVTNHHVIDGCSRLRVNGVAAQMRGSDERSDLALLNVSLPGPSSSLRAQRAAVGEPVAVAGYPLRGLLSGFNMTTGNLSSLSGMGGDTRLVQITAPVQPGNSGGPVLDSAGNLMGVVVSKLDAIKAAKITGDIPQNVNFAINANVLRSFLDANSVEYDTASSDKVLLTTAIAEKAKGFTVLVECWK